MNQWLVIALGVASAIALVKLGLLLGTGERQPSAAAPERYAPVEQVEAEADSSPSAEDWRPEHIPAALSVSTQIQAWIAWNGSVDLEYLTHYCEGSASALECLNDAAAQAGELAILLPRVVADPNVLLLLHQLDCIPTPAIGTLGELRECFQRALR